MYRNDQFNAEELALGEKFKSKFRQTSLTVVSFHDVEFSYDQIFLQRELEDCETLLHEIVQRHLTEKSHRRIDMVFAFFKDGQLMDKLFAPDGVHRDLLAAVVGYLNVMLEQNKL